MKKCSYCGKQAENDAVFCPSCGASDFVYICQNCGSVIEDGKYCSKCGVKAGTEPKHCPECGNEYFTNACPNCGYTENRLSDTAPNYGYTYRTQTQPVTRKRQTWLWVLGWIFIFPVPATILLARSKKLNNLLKIILIAAVWLLYFLWVGGSKAAEDAKNSSAAFADTSAAAVVVQYEGYGAR